MAQVVLSAVGSAIGGPVGGVFGRTLGGVLDREAIASLTPARQVGRRLSGLQLNSTAEGAPMPAAWGRARVGAQVIWAARFKERRVAVATGGGKGGPSAYGYNYSLSFAVALCEGPIDGVGRIWADGRPMDMTAVVMRVHLGGPDDAPDPLIEAIEVLGSSPRASGAPAYRGTAYLVFEDLALDPYGSRPPHLMVEVFRRPKPAGAAPALEDALAGVCLIPGAGEFVYATEAVLRRDGLTSSTPENVNNSDGRPDLLVSLDQLQAHLPNVGEVTLVVAWFGDDLRAGVCRIRPGVEQAEKATIPLDWSAGGVTRDRAHLISTLNGGPAYGGTPADATVVQAIAELKARGYRVTLYPFVMMDVPPGNARPDPYGGVEQAAYPWRGRITCSPAPGRPGSPDKTAEAGAELAAFFGAVPASAFGVSDGAVSYSGPDEWSFRRLVMHCAALAKAAGGVDGFLLGSELVGVTTVRSEASTYPAVAALRALAADVRSMLGGATRIGYAADWTEYYGHQPRDGSGDVHFHLDPLWADPNVDFVGIDWYPPLADWGEGEGGLDAAAGFDGPHDPVYLAANVAGGEGFDWFYASDAARLAQTRMPITDGAYGEPWVFRPKDLVGWWSNLHHDRPGGLRAATPTAWTPGAKPIRLVEFGCPAVDRGANAPNLFYDPKSSESALPLGSTGARDDLGQRRALEAVLAHFADPEHNPPSSVYGAVMLEAAAAWCWDARPFPDFPARAGVWADAPDWARGHWLNGRAGQSPVADLLAVLLARGGVDAAACDLSGALGLVTGYVVERPMSLASAVQPLTEAFAFDLAERGGTLAAVDRDGAATLTLDAAALAFAPHKADDRSAARTVSPTPDAAQVRFIDAEADYQTGQALLRADLVAAGAGSGGTSALDLPVVMSAAEALVVAARRLRRGPAERDALTVYVDHATALAVEPGDVVALAGDLARLRVTRVDADESPRLSLVSAEAPDATVAGVPARWSPAPAVAVQGPPALDLLDLPPLDGFEDDARPLVALAARPWRAFDLSAGPSAASATVRATVREPATLGVTLSALPAGPRFRLDRAARLAVRVEGGVLSACAMADLLNGANACAVGSTSGGWEVLQFLDAEATGPQTWTLGRLLRAQSGSDPEMAAAAPAGAAFVLLTPDLARADVGLSERGLPLVWRAAPSGAPAAGLAMSEADFTWSGVAYRPWSPAHVKAVRQASGDVALGWIRRARLHGDGWDTNDPPLGEEAESYRVEVLDGMGVVVRTILTSAPATTYAAADLAADFPGGAAGALILRVSQRSAVWGWGAPTTRTLAL